MTDAAPLEQLCSLCGIVPDYFDIWGQHRQVPVQTRRALAAAMGFKLDTDADVRRALRELESRPWRRLLPPVIVVRSNDGAVGIPVTVPARAAQRQFEWTLTLEGGERRAGVLRPVDLAVVAERKFGAASFLRCIFPLWPVPDTGYHRFEVRSAGEGRKREAGMSLIVAPPQCYQPPALSAEGRVWGPAAQLYALRSQRNWGIGDYTDLKALVDLAARAGAGIVGVNPLHALFPHNPAHSSPYGPSTRLFLNVLYLDVEAVSDFAECEAARSMVRDAKFQARLHALRAAKLVPYEDAAAAKFEVLERLYRHFREKHLTVRDDRARAFRGFQAGHGATLRRQALFEALQEHFFREDHAIWGWPAWPEAYRDPAADAVARFAVEHRARVEFFEYLQWQAELQLDAVGKRSWDHGLGVGLYQDLAVGVERGGGETWANQQLYALGASVGAPPDDFSLRGQDWGLPPMIPHRLVDAAYAPFIATLRANMRHAGALRVDHVMCLMRLFWVPAGGTPADGAYVAYPLDDLMGIVALESRRNLCLVIGEDLGTVADAVREAMARNGVLSYHVFYFEKERDGGFKVPAAYPAQALVTASTHDLPLLGGYWQGWDIDTRAAIGLFPSEEVHQQQIAGRAQDRARLLFSLEREGLLPPGTSIHPVADPEMSVELARSIHVYLARTSSKVLVVQPADVLEQVEQVNFPGSTTQYPNWKRKLSLNLEEWPADPRFIALAEALRNERGSAVQPRTPPTSAQEFVGLRSDKLLM